MDAQVMDQQDILRRISALESASRGALSGDGTTTFLRSGNFKVMGGSIQVLGGGAFEVIAADGDKLADFTEDAMTFYDDAGNPHTVVDRDGMEVIGGPVRPLELEGKSDTTDNHSITTSYSTVCSLPFDPPDWAEQVRLRMQVHGSIWEAGSVTDTLTIAFRLNTLPVFLPEIEQGYTGNGFRDSVSNGISFSLLGLLDPVSQAFTVNVRVKTASATRSSNKFTFHCEAAYLRLP